VEIVAAIAAFSVIILICGLALDTIRSFNKDR
jgi:hypothetical protein